jgi:hypothetical protein
MCHSAGTAGMLDVGSHRTFFRCEIVCQDQPLEMKLEFAPDLYHSEVRAVCDPFFSTTFGHMFSLPFLCSSSVAAFRGLNSDNRNEACLAVSRQAHEIITPEASYSRTAFQNICQDSSSKGERCMKDTDHPVGHLSVHLRLFGRVLSRRSCASRDDQFGRGQNTGLGWSDPTFAHVSVPKVIRGVAPAQLRGDRAECFVRTAFRSRRPQ